MKEELLALRQKYRDGLIPLGEYLAAIDAALDVADAEPETTKASKKGGDK